MDEICSWQLMWIRVILKIEGGCPEDERGEHRRKWRTSWWHLDAPTSPLASVVSLKVVYPAANPSLFGSYCEKQVDNVPDNGRISMAPLEIQFSGCCDLPSLMAIELEQSTGQWY